MNKFFKLLYAISFLPITYLVLTAVRGFFFGFDICFFGCSVIKGIEALKIVLILAGVLCIIPVLPGCMIYQIIYLKKIRKNTIVQNNQNESIETKSNIEEYKEKPSENKFIIFLEFTVGLIVFGVILFLFWFYS